MVDIIAVIVSISICCRFVVRLSVWRSVIVIVSSTHRYRFVLVMDSSDLSHSIWLGFMNAVVSVLAIVGCITAVSSLAVGSSAIRSSAIRSSAALSTISLSGSWPVFVVSIAVHVVSVVRSRIPLPLYFSNDVFIGSMSIEMFKKIGKQGSLGLQINFKFRLSLFFQLLIFLGPVSQIQRTTETVSFILFIQLEPP